MLLFKKTFVRFNCLIHEIPFVISVFFFTNTMNVANKTYNMERKKLTVGVVKKKIFILKKEKSNKKAKTITALGFCFSWRRCLQEQNRACQLIFQLVFNSKDICLFVLKYILYFYTFTKIAL